MLKELWGQGQPIFILAYKKEQGVIVHDDGCRPAAAFAKASAPHWTRARLQELMSRFSRARHTLGDVGVQPPRLPVLEVALLESWVFRYLQPAQHRTIWLINGLSVGLA